MKSAHATAFAAAVLAWMAVPSLAAAAGSDGGLARQLLSGCLSKPSKEGVSALASAVHATPYSAARIRKELKRQQVATVVDDHTRPDEAQRTETRVTAFAGWDLPGPSAGSLEYSEGDYRMTRVQVATGQMLQPWRAARTWDCRLTAPVANARAIFEVYATLQTKGFGMLISADRKGVTVFTFDPDRFDIELSFEFDTPVAGLAPVDDKEGVSRIVLEDGGSSYWNEPGPGVTAVRLTRAQLLQGLDGPAQMEFGNDLMEPVVQRLTSRETPSRPG
jgi:hypothetical protein